MTWLYVVGGIVLVLIIIGAAGSSTQKTIAKLKNEYDEAMRAKDVQKIIDAGRKYYRISRPPSKLNSGFDSETAIQNDMRAAGIT